MILGKDLNKPLFLNGKDCTVSKNFCIIKPITYIWSNNIIHNCPFTVVKQIQVNITSNILTSKKEDILLQIIDKYEEKNCKVDIIRTTEGIFIKSDNVNNIENQTLNLNLKNHLALADVDLIIYWTYSVISEINRRSSERI